MGIHVTPFLKRVNISKSFCSFKVGFSDATYVVKSIDNDVTHQKISTIINILAIFIFLNIANLLLIISNH